MAVSPLTEIARAKINLTLHVGAPRADGYHPLESLVVFAEYGDRLIASPANDFGLDITGPFGEALRGFNIEDNLILKAARASGHPPTYFCLEKNLPVASGIGGGSADAAAALRLMQRLYGPIDDLSDLALSLGADVPVCLRQEPAFMSGIGEHVQPMTGLFGPMALPALLVNPGVPVSTGAIFKAYDAQISESGAPDISHDPDPLFYHDIVKLALSGRNDLQVVACQIAPIINTALTCLSAQKGARFVRMSGSGATCFAVFDDIELAQSAAEVIQYHYDDWWCVATWLGGAPDSDGAP